LNRSRDRRRPARHINWIERLTGILPDGGRRRAKMQLTQLATGGARGYVPSAFRLLQLTQ
jgi:hypothetical protein